MTVTDKSAVSDGQVKSGEVEKAKDIGILRIELRHSEMSRKLKKKKTPEYEKSDFVSEKALKGRAITNNIE